MTRETIYLCNFCGGEITFDIVSAEQIGGWGFNGALDECSPEATGRHLCRRCVEVIAKFHDKIAIPRSAVGAGSGPRCTDDMFFRAAADAVTKEQ